MAGYCGFSMSNNAVKAYDNGEKPISQWSKNQILTELEEGLISKKDLGDDFEISKEDINKILSLLKKINLKELKNFILHESSWHHTSKLYNITSFYEIDWGKIMYYDNPANDIEKEVEFILKKQQKDKEKAKQEKNAQKNAPKKYARITIKIYYDGGGFKGYEVLEGEVKGKWLYYEGGRKYLYGKSVVKIEYKNKEGN